MKTNKILILCLFISCLFIIITTNKNSTETIKIINTIDTIKFHDSIPQIIEVSGTKYNAVLEQTDDTPFNTGDGSFIDTAILRRGELRWVALSQDLLWFRGGPFHYGDSLFAHYHNETINGWWEVHDAMNARHTNRIDFLQPVGARDITGHNRHILISKVKFYGTTK